MSERFTLGIHGNFGTWYGEPNRSDPDVELMYRQNQNFHPETIMDTEEGMNQYLYEVQKNTTVIPKPKEWYDSNYSDGREEGRRRINQMYVGDSRGYAYEDEDYREIDTKFMIGPNCEKMEINVPNYRKQGSVQDVTRSLYRRANPKKHTMDYQTNKIVNSRSYQGRSDDLRLLHDPLAKRLISHDSKIPRQDVIVNPPIKYTPDKWDKHFANRASQEFSETKIKRPKDDIVQKHITKPDRNLAGKKYMEQQMKYKRSLMKTRDTGCKKREFREISEFNREGAKKGIYRSQPDYFDNLPLEPTGMHATDKINDPSMMRKNVKPGPQMFQMPQYKYQPEIYTKSDYKIDLSYDRPTGPSADRNTRHYNEYDTQPDPMLDNQEVKLQKNLEKPKVANIRKAPTETKKYGPEHIENIRPQDRHSKTPFFGIQKLEYLNSPDDYNDFKNAEQTGRSTKFGKFKNNENDDRFMTKEKNVYVEPHKEYQSDNRMKVGKNEYSDRKYSELNTTSQNKNYFQNGSKLKISDHNQYGRPVLGHTESIMKKKSKLPKYESEYTTNKTIGIRPNKRRSAAAAYWAQERH